MRHPVLVAVPAMPPAVQALPLSRAWLLPSRHGMQPPAKLQAAAALQADHMQQCSWTGILS